jgi:hypothetical protein
VYSLRVSEEEDIEWLRALDADLWPPDHKNEIVALKASRMITKQELDRVLGSVEEHRLVTEMVMTNMFGGYGMRVYDNPAAPGVPLVPVLLLIEGHLPLNTRWSLLDGQPAATKVPGSGRDEAWTLFSRYTHSEQNQAWLKLFGLKPSRSRSHYDY